ncbi:hypothetical protein AB0C13_39870, partial [Streptomyces sp. NPDC049099]|uniref:hypothetical protein n=1 Tax=Streptomyces sp. NPDC049099 TaxID=3155768 RepID=UPI003430D86A
MAGGAARRNAQATPVGLGEPVPADGETATVPAHCTGTIQHPRADTHGHGRTQTDIGTDGDDPAPGSTDQPADAPADDGSPVSRTDADRTDTAGNPATRPPHSGPAPGIALADHDLPGADADEAVDRRALPRSHADGRRHRRTDHDVVHLPRSGRRRSPHGRRRGGRGPLVLVGRRGAINLREREDGTDDELIGAELVSADDDLLLIS